MYKSLGEITLQSLKENCTLIHYFGLGFIQVKLDYKNRVHFYNSKLPAIVGEEEIHNHRYDFKSYVLAGEFEQEMFMIEPGETHVLEQESCKAGVMPETKSTNVTMRRISTQKFAAGSIYTVTHDLFHRVEADYAITLIERGPVIKEFADVVRFKEAEKVCPFSKQISEEELWEMVEDMLNKCKPVTIWQAEQSSK